MFAKVKQFFQFPYFTDSDKTRIARILQIFLWVILSLMGIHLFLEAVGVFESRPSDLIIEGGMVLLLLGLLAANRLGYTYIASFIFVSLIWTAFTLFSFTNRGLRGTAVIAYLAILATASLLLGWRTVIGFAVLCLIAVWGMAYAEETGRLTPILDVPYPVAIEINFILVWSTVALVIATTGLRTALQRARQSEQSLLERNKELENIRISLEEQVMVRTRGLQQVAVLSEQLNAILNFDQLLVELVNRIQENFGYYYVQIYLLDDNRQNLVMAAGAGQVGQQLKSQGHHLLLNTPTSLVAQAAREKRIIRIDDVNQWPAWLPNLLLPQTQAEMVVPIVLEEQVVGVLDVQVDRLAGLDETDAGILRSLANQVAVALRNARLFEQAEQSLAQAQATQERYLAQAWHSVGTQAYIARTQQPGSLELAESIQAKLAAAAQQQPQPTLLEGSTAEAGSENYRAIVAPIKLQNQVIGSLYFHHSQTTSAPIWSEQELALVQAITDQVAQAAENLRLFDETRQRADYERLVSDITQKMRQAPTLDLLAKTMAEELGHALGVDHSLVKVGLKTQPAAPDGLSSQSNGKN